MIQNHQKNIGIRSKLTGKNTGRSKIPKKHWKKILNHQNNTGIRSKVTKKKHRNKI